MLLTPPPVPGKETENRFARVFDLFEQGLVQEETKPSATLSEAKEKQLLAQALTSLHQRPKGKRKSASKASCDNEFFRRIRAAGGGFDMGDLGEPLL